MPVEAIAPSVRVISPAAPIVTPGDIPGSHAAGDTAIAALIAAVTEDIAGPGGWLGRSLGRQTLELSLASLALPRVLLPCRPVLPDTASVQYLDRDHAVRTVDPSHYKVFNNAAWFQAGFVFPPLADAPDAIRIRYDAGHDGAGRNGPVPERARQVIILCVQDLMRMRAGDLALRAETVDGVGATSYLDQDRVSAIVQQACERLLARLWVPVL